jgi:hypothetical protein
MGGMLLPSLMTMISLYPSNFLVLRAKVHPDSSPDVAACQMGGKELL